jgi:hypothetical protein
MATVKIRLSNGDVRLRLSEFEVAMFLEGREITTAVTEEFTLTLVPTDDSGSSIEDTGSSHTVKVSSAEVVSPSMVSPHMYENAPGQTPHILVEMDRQG